MSIQTRQTPRAKYDIVNKGYVDKQLANIQRESGGIPMLEILSGTVSVTPHTTERHVGLPVSFEKYELRTVRVTNQTNDSPVTVRIGEVNDVREARYISLRKPVIDDIIQYPMYDRDETEAVHMWIENNSAAELTVAYELRITNLS